MEKYRANSLWLGIRLHPQGLLNPGTILPKPTSPGVSIFLSSSLWFDFRACGLVSNYNIHVMTPALYGPVRTGVLYCGKQRTQGCCCMLHTLYNSYCTKGHSWVDIQEILSHSLFNKSMHTNSPAVRYRGKTMGAPRERRPGLRIFDKGMVIRVPLCCWEQN